MNKPKNIAKKTTPIVFLTSSSLSGHFVTIKSLFINAKNIKKFFIFCFILVFILYLYEQYTLNLSNCKCIFIKWLIINLDSYSMCYYKFFLLVSNGGISAKKLVIEWINEVALDQCFCRIFRLKNPYGYYTKFKCLDQCFGELFSKKVNVFHA